MITTANYLLIATLNGVQHVFEYEDCGDVWSALGEFFADDYPEIIDEDKDGQFPIDVMAMDDGKVIKCYEVAFHSGLFDHFFAKGWRGEGEPYTLDEFQKDVTEVRQNLNERKGNCVTFLMHYMWNKWCKEECMIVYQKDFWPHFWNKWCTISEMYDRFGAVEHFYAELSDNNRGLLVKRAVEVYNMKKCV